MRKSSLFAVMLSVCQVWLPTVASGSDKRHGPEAVLVLVEGCLKMSVGEYVVVDETGTRRYLTGSTAKLSHSVGRLVQIVGEPTTEAVDTAQAGIAPSVAELPALRVQSSWQIGGRCDR